MKETNKYFSQTEWLEYWQPDLGGRQLSEAVVENTTSISHGVEHIQTVLRYAAEIGRKYDAQLNKKILFAAICVHDLGKNSPAFDGIKSSRESIRLARPLLIRFGYQEMLSEIERIVLEHDTFYYRPSSMEGVILKDADYLAGLGANGIIRILMSTIEAGGSVSSALDIIELKTPRRIAELVLPESQAIAWRLWPTMQLFLSQMKAESGSPKEVFPAGGDYYVLEGISGSGKDTQAEMMAQWLKSRGKEAVLVHEPSELCRETLEKWKAAGNLDAFQRALLITADRQRLMMEIAKLLNSGKVVLGVRSFVSTLVYQSADFTDLGELWFLNRFTIRPKRIFFLKTDPDIAMARTELRGNPKGDFEEEDLARRLATRYEDVRHLLEGWVSAELIPTGNKTVAEVFKCIEDWLRGDFPLPPEKPGYQRCHLPTLEY